MADQAPASAPGDRYAVNKANIRDTIKWLAGIFGSLAAVVIAGTPVSGLGPLYGTPRFLPAAATLLLGFACICACLVVTLRLLRSDVLYFSDINPDNDVKKRDNPSEVQWIRDDIQAHQVDLFPGETDMRALIKKSKEMAAKQMADEKAWKELQLARPPDDPEITRAKFIFDAQAATVASYSNINAEVLAYATYRRFYRRLARATPWLIGLGVAALVFLMGFSVATQTKKEEPKPTIVVAPIAAALMPASPASAPDARAYVPSGVVQFSARTTLSASDAAVVESVRRTMMSNPSTVVFLATSSQASADTTEAARLAREREDAVSALLTAQGSVAKSRIFTAELAAIAPQSAGSATQAQSANQSVNLYLVQAQP